MTQNRRNLLPQYPSRIGNLDRDREVIDVLESVQWVVKVRSHRKRQFTLVTIELPTTLLVPNLFMSRFRNLEFSIDDYINVHLTVLQTLNEVSLTTSIC